MAEIQNRWVNHLRNNARQGTADRLSCPSCAADVQPDIDSFRAHIRADEPKHSDLAADADIEEAFRKMSIHPPQQRPESASPKPGAAGSPHSPRKRRVSRHLDEEGTAGSKQHSHSTQQDVSSTSASVHKKPRSPSSSLAQATSPPTTPNIRPNRRGTAASDFDRGDAAKNPARQLWTPVDEPKNRHSRNKSSNQRRSRRPAPTGQPELSVVLPADVTTNPNFVLFRQPPTNPITQEQLISEVKGIYEGLTLVEKKCIELSDPDKTSIPADQKLSVEQYQKLIGLHRTLLHEHHDFFLASQHPSAHSSLRRLPSKYNMPARMWRHGIQSFLEFLRKRLPDSLEHMLTFIYIAYSNMTLLYETVSVFVETWIECLGDLGRYRMAIEDDDIRDRETWTSVSRYWYSKASDRLPTVGRLYHHLAILARPDALQQLYYYTKSLCVPVPFLSAWDSIMTLFDPVLSSRMRLDPVDEAFVKVHGILFSGKSRDQLDLSISEYLSSIDVHIAKKNKEWLHPGYCTGISLICSLFGYGATTNPLKLALSASESSTETPLVNNPKAKNVVNKEIAERTFTEAKSFAMETIDLIFRREEDVNILPFFHTIMVFMHYVTQHPEAISMIQDDFPWKRTVDLLNASKPALMSKSRMEEEGFPRPPANEPLRPLPEDYAMRGLAMSKYYFPEKWFSSDKLDDDEKMFELPSLADERRQRVLWLGRRIAHLGKWIQWDASSEEFTVNAAYDEDSDDEV